MYHVVASRLSVLGVQSKHFGPHGLRHACATHLVAQGLSLKEIGDHLGHRSVYATRTYVRIDLAGLRDVGAFNLGGPVSSAQKSSPALSITDSNRDALPHEGPRAHVVPPLGR